MTKKSKLNAKATATLVEYRTALDIKNSIDKLVSQLKNEFTEIVNNHKLVNDKKNFVLILTTILLLYHNQVVIYLINQKLKNY